MKIWKISIFLGRKKIWMWKFNFSSTGQMVMSIKYVNKYIRNLPHSDLERRPIRKYRHPRHTRPACWRASFPAGSGETEGMWRRRRREREGGRRLSPGTQQQCENTLAQQEYNHGSSLLVPTPRGFSTLFFIFIVLSRVCRSGSFLIRIRIRHLLFLF